MRKASSRKLEGCNWGRAQQGSPTVGGKEGGGGSIRKSQLWRRVQQGSIRKSQVGKSHVSIRKSPVRIRKSPVRIRADTVSIRKSREHKGRDPQRKKKYHAPLFWGPYNKDPTTLGYYIRVPYFRKLPYAFGQAKRAASSVNILLFRVEGCSRFPGPLKGGSKK